MSRSQSPAGLTHISDVTLEALQTVNACNYQPRFLLPGALQTGREGIDREIGGLLAGDVLRLSGPRGGLLRATLRLVLDVARQAPANGRRVLLCMPEAHEEFVGIELLSAATGFLGSALREGGGAEGSLTMLRERAESLSRFPLWLDTQASSAGAIDRRLWQLERRGTFPVQVPRAVFVLGGQQSWRAALQGEALGLALRRLARRRRSAVVWVEEADDEPSRIPRALLTGELTIFGPPATQLVLSWHRRRLERMYQLNLIDPPPRVGDEREAAADSDERDGEGEASALEDPPPVTESEASSERDR